MNRSRIRPRSVFAPRGLAGPNPLAVAILRAVGCGDWFGEASGSRPTLCRIGWTQASESDDARTLAPPAAGLHRRSEELARLEAALFLAREPLAIRRLAKLARLPDGSRARALLKELRTLQDDSGSAFRVEQIAGGYQLLTRLPFGPWVRRLLDRPPGARLSSAALETLAIVAYRQPVTRAEIESIRGVGSEEMLRQLLERDLVAVGGRAEDLGRPNVYVTTRHFLAVFGLARIEDLPAFDLGAGGSDREAAGRDAGDASG
jgi:segregation and condensation protein B